LHQLSGDCGYLDGFISKAHSEITDEGLLKLRAILNLLSHKNPNLRILELGNSMNEIIKATLDLLCANKAFERLHSYTVGSLSERGDLLGAAVSFEDGELQEPLELTGQTFDLILLPYGPTASTYLENRFASIKMLMKPNGLLLATSSSGTESLSSEMSVVQCSSI